MTPKERAAVHVLQSTSENTVKDSIALAHCLNVEWHIRKLTWREAMKIVALAADESEAIRKASHIVYKARNLFRHEQDIADADSWLERYDHIGRR